MRTLFILMLISLPVLSMAQTPEERITAAEKEAEAARDKALMDWRLQNVPENEELKLGTELYDRYLEAHKTEWNKYRTAYVTAREEICKQPNVVCNPDQLTRFNSQVNVAIALQYARQKWAKENVPAGARSQREQEFKDCVENNRNCEKLPEGERDIATENRGGSGSTPAEENPDKPEVTVTADQDVEAMRTSLEDELKKKKEAFEASNPGWETAEMSEAIAKLHLELESWKLQEMLKGMAALCEKYKEDRFCSEEAINAVKAVFAGSSCKIQRRAQAQTLNTDKKKLNDAIVENHDAEWNALNPKTCETLLKKDRDGVTPTRADPEETPVEVEAQEPGNYDSSSCEWSADMPRRIVNGPGCAGNCRSRMCTGYVICKQKNSDAKFVRMSTCHQSYCKAGKEMAVKCTQDRRFFSTKPADEDKMFATPRIRRALTSGASEQ